MLMSGHGPGLSQIMCNFSAKQHQAKTKWMFPTCASYPDISVVPIWANLLLHSRARSSHETFSARTLSCELRKEKCIRGTWLWTLSWESPPSNALEHQSQHRDNLLHSTCVPGDPRLLVLGCRHSHGDANGLQTAPALQSRGLSFVSKTKESPTSSRFAISSLLTALSSFGTYL